MPKLTIDEREIQVPEGTKVIEAAERLGIMIPRFCYHPALGSVGACRVCAVKCLQGPFKGVQMSCMLDAQDGMVVSTTDPEAVDFRRHVIEWLMLHHPHDCPVCDEGGHCLLQDMTISGGHGRRRYEGLKRTYRDQDLGPLVQHEMNRCIHCYRCARFYQEFCGYRDLGVLQIANRTYFGRFAPGTLESPFAGNLSDICPTGVYTDKPARYKGRRWDFERTPAFCINCSLGCHTVVSARFREIVRQEARLSPTVNGHFICDRGRFGFYYAEAPGRPRQARVNGRPAPPGDGRREAAAELQQVAASLGRQAVAVLGGQRSSLETQAALHHLCREQNWQGPAFFANAAAQARAAAAVRLAPDLAVSMGAIEQADTIVVVGCDPVNEAPMLALALRQAQRTGATVVVLDPRPVALPMDTTHIALPPEALGNALGWLAAESVSTEAAASLGPAAAGFHRDLGKLQPPAGRALAPVAGNLRRSRRTAIVCGTALAAAHLPEMAGDTARLFQATGRWVGLFYTLPQAGSYGAALLGGPSWEDIIADIEIGKVKALVVVETDPLTRFHDRTRLAQALDRLELLVVLDYLDSAIGRRAHIQLPAASVYESGGRFANQEGRLQRIPKVVSGGGAILQTGGGSHPPRTYATDVPGSELPSPARVLGELAGDEAPKTTEDPIGYLTGAASGLPFRTTLAKTAGGDLRLISASAEDWHFDPARITPETPPNGLSVVLTDWTFGTETLSVRSPCLEGLTPAPLASLHPDDARDRGLSDGDHAVVIARGGRLTVAVQVTDRVAPGVLVLPRHYRLGWQIFASEDPRIALDLIAPAAKEREDTP